MKSGMKKQAEKPVPGINVTWKAFIYLIALSVICLSSLACGSMQNPGSKGMNSASLDLIKDPLKKAPGCPDSKTDPESFQVDDNGMFCGSDTYIIKVQGGIEEKYKNSDPEIRKVQSKKMAIIIARYILIEQMRKLRDEFVAPVPTDKADYNITGFDPWYLELTKIARSGKVLCEKYDNDQTCIMIYAFYKKDFRTWIKTEKD